MICWSVVGELWQVVASSLSFVEILSDRVSAETISSGTYVYMYVRRDCRERDDD